MTISYGIDHVSGNSTESVTTIVAEKDTLVLVAPDKDPKSGRISATYSVGSGDVNHPATLDVAIDPVVIGKSRYGTFTFKTWATQTDSVTGIVTYWPVQATVSFNIGAGAPVQLADFNKLIAAAFSYTYASVTAGVRDTAWLQKLLYGSPTVV